MFTTQTIELGSIVWKEVQDICQGQKRPNFDPPLPPNIRCWKFFDVFQEFVPSKGYFNKKKHYESKNAILK